MNPPFLYSQNGYHLTESFEACKLKAYGDSGGVWTIGWGHTRGVGPGLTCIQAQADAWLHEDVAFAEAAVNDLVKSTINQAEFDALVDFVFNVGVEAFKGSSMLGYLNTNNYMLAADELEKWDYAHGQRVIGLLRRREAERDLFNQGSGEPQGAD